MELRNCLSDNLVAYNTRAHSPNVAAIDLGTNSCRILIASINIPNLHRNCFKRKGAIDNRIKVIDSFARVVGLGEGIKQTGQLSKNAIDRTIDTLEICNHKIKFHNVLRLRAVATEACRQARNADTLIERTKVLTGICLEIVSPQEEAQLVLKGCMGVMSEDDPYGIVIDIGGGSTEVIWLRIGRGKNPTKSSMSKTAFAVLDSMSLPYGVVTLKDTYVHDGYDAQTYDMAQQAITQDVSFFFIKNRIFDHIKKNEVQIVASSGTVTTLASLVLGLPSYDRRLIDGREFNSADLQRVGNNLKTRYMSKCSFDTIAPNELSFLLHRIGDVTADSQQKDSEQLMLARVGLLAAGTTIFNAILSVIGNHPLRIADRGVREGIIHELADALKNEQSNFF
jgi:exopolyphosphatase/guanosine-5'-triphosphate,3'-diphosphate pyrophosphatase